MRVRKQLIEKVNVYVLRIYSRGDRGEKKSVIDLDIAARFPQVVVTMDVGLRDAVYFQHDIVARNRLLHPK